MQPQRCIPFATGVGVALGDGTGGGGDRGNRVLLDAKKDRLAKNGRRKIPTPTVPSSLANYLSPARL